MCPGEGSFQPPDKVLEKCKQEEFDMALQDKVMEETKERKNAVEAYVYSMRSKLEEGGQLFDYVKEDTRTSFKELLNNTEDWLYEDGEDEAKGVYVNKLEELSSIGNPIEERYNEEHKRPGAIAALEYACQMIKQTSQDEAHAHIDAEDLKKVQKKQISTEPNHPEMAISQAPIGIFDIFQKNGGQRSNLARNLIQNSCFGF